MLILPLKSEFIQKIYNNKKRHLGKNPQIVNTGQLPINDGQLLTRDERGIVFGVWTTFQTMRKLYPLFFLFFFKKDTGLNTHTRKQKI